MRRPVFDYVSRDLVHALVDRYQAPGRVAHSGQARQAAVNTLRAITGRNRGCDQHATQAGTVDAGPGTRRRLRVCARGLMWPLVMPRPLERLVRRARVRRQVPRGIRRQANLRRSLFMVCSQVRARLQRHALSARTCLVTSEAAVQRQIRALHAAIPLEPHQRFTMEVGSWIVLSALGMGVQLGGWSMSTMLLVVGAYFGWVIAYSEASLQADRRRARRESGLFSAHPQPAPNGKQ